MNNRFIGTAIVIATAVCDQLSKWAVTEYVFRAKLHLGQPMRFADWLRDAPDRMTDVSRSVTSFFNLTMVWNEGISFGLMHTGGWGALTILSLVIASGFFVWMWRVETRLETLALALVIGGAVGNAFDRIRFGAVVDYLDFHAGQWHFPAFNVADSAISIGVALLLIQGLFFARKSA